MVIEKYPTLCTKRGYQLSDIAVFSFSNRLNFFFTKQKERCINYIKFIGARKTTLWKVKPHFFDGFPSFSTVFWGQGHRNSHTRRAVSTSKICPSARTSDTSWSLSRCIFHVRVAVLFVSPDSVAMVNHGKPWWTMVNHGELQSNYSQSTVKVQSNINANLSSLFLLKHVVFWIWGIARAPLLGFIDIQQGMQPITSGLKGSNMGDKPGLECRSLVDSLVDIRWY